MVSESKSASKTRVRTLRDRLAHLSPVHVHKLLGTEAKRLMRAGSRHLVQMDFERDVYFRGDLFRLTLPHGAGASKPVRVTITLKSDRQRRILCNCDHCTATCDHMGAALGFILDEKFALGLSDIPKEGTPLELLSEEVLEQRAIAERALRAKEERFRIEANNSKTPWTDYLVTSQLSGKTYRVALRGCERGDS